MNSRSLRRTRWEAIAQLCTPSYWLVRGRAAHVPLQRTTATIGSALAASFPRMVATLPITGAPPTGHNRPSNVSAFTQAVAKPPHPGYPQPPQLAPGNTSWTLDVVVDGTEKTYTYTFEVPTKSTTKLQVKAANAWSNFAYLEGEIVSSASTLDDTGMTFEYQTSGASSWTTLSPVKEGDLFKATLKGLTPNTTYSYRLKYSDGTEEYISDAVSFTTEVATALVNGNMDDWYQSGKTWYAASEGYFTENGGSFWDSSNPGTTTGAGALVNVNPTQGNSVTVHTAGGKSAELKSQYASAFGIGKFAAASLYAGSFNSLVGTNGAKIDFGQPFTSRPTRLHGFFRYTAGTIDYVGSNTPSNLGIISGSTPDVCSIYIALTTRTYQVDNTDTSTFIDYENDSGIVAYGELPVSECVSTDGLWKEFNIDLKYRTAIRN